MSYAGVTGKEVIVIGGGLAGLSASMKLAELGCSVKLISVTSVKRSHSVCAQGGINAAINTAQEEDSPLIHAYDTIKGGDFLANQPPVLEMCLAAPGIIRLMERIGCPFNRTVEGNLDVRRFGGTLYRRTVFCGASTGQQLLYSLDEQVRRWEVEKRIHKFEHHEFMRLVMDETGRACGIVMLDLFTLKLEILKADAVVVASGGPGLIFKKSTNSTFCTGAANGRLYKQGMLYANGEFIQVHPTAIPGEDKLRLISESTRGEGGRIWVYGNSARQITLPDGSGSIPCGEDGKPWYFLEALYPAFGNLVPRDIASREILRICEMGLGIEGGPQVFLDVSHLPAASLKKLESVLEIYEKFTGSDPHKLPMRIFPAVHYSMGGGWVDWPASDDSDRYTRFRQMTNIPGLFNIGESDYQYHGANRLGANSLLSCIFGGLTAGIEIPRYIESQPKNISRPDSLFLASLEEEEQAKTALFENRGTENVHLLHDELSEVMIQHVTVNRNNANLKFTLNRIKELRERCKRIQLADSSQTANKSFIFARRFGPMLDLSEAITASALGREESRGAHSKAEFPDRNDKAWLKTTLARYDAQSDSPVITYEAVDTRHFDPVLRDYTKAVKVQPKVSNFPATVKLPV